jgi:hypothetical protein
MKKTTIVLLALAFAMFVAAPSFADDIKIEISVNGGSFNTLCTGTGSCQYLNFSDSGLTITTLNGSNNVPGTATLAVTSTTNLNVNYSGASPLNFQIRATSDGFTNPASSPLIFTVHEATTPSPGTSFDFTTTGSLLGVPGCSLTTASLDGTTSSGQDATSLCSNSGTFSLVSLATFNNVASGSSFDASTRITAAAIPEPASIALLGSGLLGLAGTIRRKLGK